MKLRQAKKIYKELLGDKPLRHSHSQIIRAGYRISLFHGMYAEKYLRVGCSYWPYSVGAVPFGIPSIGDVCGTIVENWVEMRNEWDSAWRGTD